MIVLEKPVCGFCGALSRPMTAPGKGLKARRQNSRRRVCANGHTFEVKQR